MTYQEVLSTANEHKQKQKPTKTLKVIINLKKKEELEELEVPVAQERGI